MRLKRLLDPAKATMATTVPTPLQYRAAVNGQLSKTGHASVAFPRVFKYGAYGKAGNGSWKRKWEQKIHQSLVQCFLHI